MKDILSMTILAVAIVGATWMYVERQPVYSFEIIYEDDDRFNSLTIRTNVVNGYRCLVKDEGLLAVSFRGWSDTMSGMPGPKIVCETNKHWRDFRGEDRRFNSESE